MASNKRDIMKLQRIVFISLILQMVAAPLHASNLVTILDQSAASLISSQQYLTSLLNIVNQADNIPVAINAPAYSAPLVITPPAVVINNNIRADWQPQATSSYTYKNSTTIPLIVAITNGTMSNTQQIAPGQIYTQEIAPATSVTVKAHANVSAIKTSYTSSASYTLTLDEYNKLSLTQTAATGNTITNSCGWPMLISFIAVDNTRTNITLQDSNRYQAPATTVGILVIPLILDQKSSAAAVASCTVANTNGALALQFAA